MDLKIIGLTMQIYFTKGVVKQQVLPSETGMHYSKSMYFFKIEIFVT